MKKLFIFIAVCAVIIIVGECSNDEPTAEEIEVKNACYCANIDDYGYEYTEEQKSDILTSHLTGRKMQLEYDREAILEHVRNLRKCIVEYGELDRYEYSYHQSQGTLDEWMLTKKDKAVENAKAVCAERREYSENELDMACDCWNATYAKTRIPYDNLDKTRQETRKKCNEVLDGEEYWKKACEIVSKTNNESSGYSDMDQQNDATHIPNDSHASPNSAILREIGRSYGYIWETIDHVGQVYATITFDDDRFRIRSYNMNGHTNSENFTEVLDLSGYWYAPSEYVVEGLVDLSSIEIRFIFNEDYSTLTNNKGAIYQRIGGSPNTSTRIRSDANQANRGQSVSSKYPGKYPFTSERPLTHEDLFDKSKAELRFMRNEIYARHGMIFKTDDMRNHFSAQSWYKGIHSDVSSFLSEIELTNVNLILRYEK